MGSALPVTQQVMPWAEIKKRAAINPQWPWHRMDGLDSLKADLLHKDQWRENGNYVEKPPFPKPQTDVRVQELARDDDSGEVTLRLTPVHSDTLHYEIGTNATSASRTVSGPKQFKTRELTVTFLCVDSKGEHETGQPIVWHNRITIKSRIYQGSNDKMVELRAAPDVPLRYTTDGSDPKLSGVVYEGPFVILQNSQVVLAVAEKQGVVATHRLDINWDEPIGPVDPERPTVWHREHVLSTTQEAYEFLAALKQHEVTVPSPRLSIAGRHWLELSCDLTLDATALENTLNHLRGLLDDGQVSIEALSLHFPTGQRLLDWVETARTELKPGEVEQS